MTVRNYTFRAATPVWEIGTAKTPNHTVCFTADIPATNKPVTVSAAASCAFYRMRRCCIILLFRHTTPPGH